MLSVVSFKVFAAHLAVAVMKHFFSLFLSFAERRAGTLYTGDDPDSSLQAAVNPITILLSSYIKKTARLALLWTFRKGIPCVASWGGWAGEGTENFLFGPGSVFFCGGPSVRQTYRTPSTDSAVHVKMPSREINKPDTFEFSAYDL